MKKILEIVIKVLGFQLQLSVVGLLVVFGGVALLSASVIRKNPEMLGLLKGPEILQQEEAAFVAKVGRSISLPSDEKPTVVSVKELDKSSEQQFFKSAQPEDKVLIYTNAKKVILYRPSEERVVEVGTVNVQGKVDSDKTENKLSPFKLAILNGTEIEDLPQKLEEELKGVVPEGEVVFRASAAKLDYEKTLVIDLTGNKATETEELAKKIGAEVVQLPEGEEKPEQADILVIIGKDKNSS